MPQRALKHQKKEKQELADNKNKRKMFSIHNSETQNSVLACLRFISAAGFWIEIRLVFVFEWMVFFPRLRLAVCECACCSNTDASEKRTNRNWNINPKLELHRMAYANTLLWHAVRRRKQMEYGTVQAFSFRHFSAVSFFPPLSDTLCSFVPVEMD